jgi:3-oxoacid CoA-transferase subunit A
MGDHSVGGFGLCGIPNLILALRDRGTSNLTVISSNAGVDDWPRDAAEDTPDSQDVSTYVGENKRKFERRS